MIEKLTLLFCLMVSIAVVSVKVRLYSFIGLFPSKFIVTPYLTELMIPRILLDSAQIPGKGGTLLLHQHDSDFTISIEGGGLLMDTRSHGSEVALAHLACKKIVTCPQPRVLIGGLGMGFTLAAALRLLGDDAEVEVAELVPEVVVWNRGPLGKHAGYPLHDKRTTIRNGDVATVLKRQRQGYNAIILDVDNGPEGLTRKKNDWLYTLDGLSASYKALKSDGILAVWSAGPDRRFSERLRKAGFRVQQSHVRAHDNKGALHTIWFAQRGP